MVDAILVVIFLNTCHETRRVAQHFGCVGWAFTHASGELENLLDLGHRISSILCCPEVDCWEVKKRVCFGRLRISTPVAVIVPSVEQPVWVTVQITKLHNITETSKKR